MRWPGYQHIFFDCDSTLSTIEGIDVLARHAGKQWRIEVLTNAAMDGDLELEAVYGKRLQAIRPTRAQVQAIRHAYKSTVSEDARAVLDALKLLGHDVYIISGGLAQPVVDFGVHLGVPAERIRAVHLHYDQLSGDWWRSDDAADWKQTYLAYQEGALTISDGKADIVKELLGGRNGRSLLIGDGTSDLRASREVNLFVGFGGVVARPTVKENAPAFINSQSLAPLLHLAAGPAASRRLKGTPYETVFAKGADLINSGALTFNDERLKQKFSDAYQTVYPRSNGGPA